MAQTIKFTAPFFAYKGFDKDLKCRKEQFVIGETYEKPEREIIRMCSDDGYHYCKEIKSVFGHYSRGNGNRFCKIEILGNYADDNDNKSITTKFRIVEELGIAFFKALDAEVVEQHLNLTALRALQTQYPMFHVGGSTGLFLHGLYLKRWANHGGDLDIVSPYFVLPENFDGATIDHTDAKGSGNDFDETFYITLKNGESANIDYKIDPHQRYEIIEYKGFKYKVSPLEVIVEAKIRYALLKNGVKHKQDMYELLGKKSSHPPQVETDLYGNNIIQRYV